MVFCLRTHKTPIATSAGEKTVAEITKSFALGIRGEGNFDAPEAEESKFKTKYKSICAKASRIFGKKPITLVGPEGGLFKKEDQ